MSIIATNLVDAKYGRLHLQNPSESVAPGYHGLDDFDEPVFVLRAQDDLAMAIITRYANMARQIEDPDKLPSAEWFAALDSVVAEFGAFRSQHSDRVKIPD